MKFTPIPQEKPKFQPVVFTVSLESQEEVTIFRRAIGTTPAFKGSVDLFAFLARAEAGVRA